MAVYEEQEAQQRGVANTSLAPSPDLYQSELSVFQPITGGEIEVNSSALKSSKYFFIYLTVYFCCWCQASPLTCGIFASLYTKPTPLKSNQRRSL